MPFSPQTIRALPRSALQFICLLEWKNSCNELSANSVYKMTFVGPFVVFGDFFKWLLLSMAKEQVLPGSDYSSSWEKTGFCCWGLWCSLKKAALIQCPSSPLSTGTWGPRPCSHWLLSPHWQGQSLVNDWFKLIFLYAWDYNRSSETTHFPSSKIPSRDTID